MTKKEQKIKLKHEKKSTLNEILKRRKRHKTRTTIIKLKLQS
jgi:hypothetical protein